MDTIYVIVLAFIFLGLPMLLFIGLVLYALFAPKKYIPKNDAEARPELAAFYRTSTSFRAVTILGFLLFVALLMALLWFLVLLVGLSFGPSFYILIAVLLILLCGVVYSKVMHRFFPKDEAAMETVLVSQFDNIPPDKPIFVSAKTRGGQLQGLSQSSISGALRLLVFIPVAMGVVLIGGFLILWLTNGGWLAILVIVVVMVVLALLGWGMNRDSYKKEEAAYQEERFELYRDKVKFFPQGTEDSINDIKSVQIQFGGWLDAIAGAANAAGGSPAQADYFAVLEVGSERRRFNLPSFQEYKGATPNPFKLQYALEYVGFEKVKEEKGPKYTVWTFRRKVEQTKG